MNGTVFVHDQALKAHALENLDPFFRSEDKDPGGEGIGVHAISCNDTHALASLGRVPCLRIEDMVKTLPIQNKVSLVVT